MEKQSFEKRERIRKSRDYLAIYRRGGRQYSKHFTVVSCGNALGFRRFGITVSKKVGSAVQRNRVKRLLREFYRLNRNRFAASQDTVIIAKASLPPLRYGDVYQELAGLLIKKADV